MGITSATWVAVAKVDPGEMQCTGLAACKDHFCNQNSDILETQEVSHISSQYVQRCTSGVWCRDNCVKCMQKAAREKCAGKHSNVTAFLKLNIKFLSGKK